MAFISTFHGVGKEQAWSGSLSGGVKGTGNKHHPHAPAKHACPLQDVHETTRQNHLPPSSTARTATLSLRLHLAITSHRLFLCRCCHSAVYLSHKGSPPRIRFLDEFPASLSQTAFSTWPTSIDLPTHTRRYSHHHGVHSAT